MMTMTAKKSKGRSSLMVRENSLSSSSANFIRQQGKENRHIRQREGNMSWKVEECIVSRSVSPEEALIKVVAACFDPKRINEVLEYLASELPLGDFNLLHAKRVRKARDLNGMVEVLICPESKLEDRSTEGIQALLQSALNKRTVIVASYPATTQSEFDEWNPHWPISFHINELERQRKRGIPKDEVESILRLWERVVTDHIKVTEELGWTESSGGCGGLIVDPVSNTVLCTVSQALEKKISDLDNNIDLVLSNPLLCPTLLCINHVAMMASGHCPGKGQFELIFVAIIISSSLSYPWFRDIFRLAP